MHVVPSHEVLIITAAAAGAALTAHWWAGRGRRPHSAPHALAQDRVEELHWAFRDPTVPSADSPTEALRRYWSWLHPLQFAPPEAPAAPAHRSLLSRSSA
ncbi:hypothetical protein ACFVP3_38745 [Streptomyces sp. NPDC057806]|uniref:hypothetical protein n=1 Tax=Streptomyces sp. NPDC057806 TaxID=3346255 RepID=UPI0036BBA4FC